MGLMGYEKITKSKVTAEYDRLCFDYKNKIVLNIQACLWVPFEVDSGDLNINIFMYDKNGEIMYVNSSKLFDRPYANHNIVNAAVRFSKRKTKLFIPIGFPSIDKLQEVAKIALIWHLDSFREGVNEYCIIEYIPTFDDRLTCDYGALGSYCVPIRLMAVNSDILSQYDDADERFKSDNGKRMTEVITGEFDDVYVSKLITGSDISGVAETHVMYERHKDDMNESMDFESLSGIKYIRSIEQARSFRYGGRSTCYVDYYIQTVTSNDLCFI